MNSVDSVKKYKVLLADDHTLMRAGLRALLDTINGFEVVAEACDGDEALDLLRRHEPDVALMDIDMKRMSGLEAMASAKREFPKLHVIMLSMHAEKQYVMQALRDGASGYLLKDAATVELELALSAVVKGDVYLSTGVSKQVVEGFVRQAAVDPVATLTPRQREILTLVAQGHNTKEIAFRLGRSTKTVEAHRAELMERLDIHDIPGLVRFTIRAGLIKLDK
jgi:DNA-binding NarL/FixJ family response regulator